MASHFRRTLIDRDRVQAAAYAGRIERGRGLRRWGGIYYVAALLWAALAALPTIYVGRPLELTAGAVAQYDIRSRVEFEWHDAESEEQALRTLESVFPRRYREESKQRWLKDVYEPLELLLVRAADAGSAGEILKTASELKVAITPEQADAVWRGAAAARNNPQYYMVRPLKETLESDVLPRGILDRERFESERGRSIQLFRDGSTVTAPVGSGRGPATAEGIKPELEQRFGEKYSIWLPVEFRHAVLDILIQRLKPTLTYDDAATRKELEDRKEELRGRSRVVQKDERLIARGETATPTVLSKLRAEERQFSTQMDWRLIAYRYCGKWLLFFCVALGALLYFRIASQSFAVRRRMVVWGGAMMLIQVFLSYLLVWLGWPETLLPIGLMAGVASLGMSPSLSVFIVTGSAMASMIVFDGRPAMLAAYLAGGWFFASFARRTRWRSLLLLLSIASGLAGSLVFIAWTAAQGDVTGIWQLVMDFEGSLKAGQGAAVSAVALLVNWSICGLLTIALLPLIEKAFGTTTRIRLQDLTVVEHPLLKRLLIEAPGTYHHCAIVATLAEAGANAIGADGLLARTGGLFHDIGKILKPEYFTENEEMTSRHDMLTPQMSALVIIGHVKDGADMARDYKLPQAVIDIIEEHHGKSIVRYFYHRAVQQAPKGETVPVQPYMYPGPQPRSLESAVVMLADTVEAASRSLDHPSPQSIRNLLHDLFLARLRDRQFEQSGLTMTQLNIIEDIFFRLLVSIYHSRVKYPGQDKRKKGDGGTGKRKRSA